MGKYTQLRCKYPHTYARLVGNSTTSAGTSSAEPAAGNGTAAWGPNGDSYTDDANANTFIVVQIETLEAVSNLEEIISTPGIDGIFVGPGDLGLRLKFSEAVRATSAVDFLCPTVAEGAGRLGRRGSPRRSS